MSVAKAQGLHTVDESRRDDGQNAKGLEAIDHRLFCLGEFSFLDLKQEFGLHLFILLNQGL